MPRPATAVVPHAPRSQSASKAAAKYVAASRSSTITPASRLNEGEASFQLIDETSTREPSTTTPLVWTLTSPWASRSISARSVGAKHGELGHTQFLPGNALKYGVDGDGDGRIDFYDTADALASTANYLRQKGWQPGLGYQEGEPNFAVIGEWNAAKVYQQAIAIMGARIGG